MPGLTVIDSDSADPFWNLAAESHFFDTCSPDASFLIFYRNNPCVIMGKNQNPWRECRLDLLAARGIPLLRRQSGGGTVFHDRGCLNFSFILPRRGYDPCRQFTVVQKALAALGLRTELGKHNSVFLGGSKISGNAFCYRKHHALHHGTLLVATCLDTLRSVLESGVPGVCEAKGVPSVPSPVTNLGQHMLDLTLEAVRESVTEAAGAEFGGIAKDYAINELSPLPLDHRVAAIRSEDWIFSRTAPFEWRQRFQNEKGWTDFHLVIEKGKIAGGAITSSVLNKKICQTVFEIVKGCPFRTYFIASRFKNSLFEGKTRVHGEFISGAFLKMAF